MLADPPTNPPPSVHLYIAILDGGGRSYTEADMCLHRLVQLAPHAGLALTVVHDAGTGVDRARNRQVAMAMKDATVTHFMFLDNDIVFDPGWVVNMVRSGLDVVAAAYPRKAIDWKMVETAVKSGVSHEKLAEYANSWIVNSVRQDGKTNAVEMEGQLFVEVEEVGTGFFMFKRQVVEKMLAAYGREMAYVTDYEPRDETHHMLFSCQRDPACYQDTALRRLKQAAEEYSRNSPSGLTELSNAAIAWAVSGNKSQDGRYLTEDYAFCRYWRMLGGRIYIYADAAVGHIGTWCFQGAIKHHFTVAPTKDEKESKGKMPLKRGKSNKTRQENIKAEIAAGKPVKQAVAIGYSEQRRSGGKKGKK